MAQNPLIVTVDGVTYFPITQERYAEMAKALELNRHARYIAVEEFRARCAANKGTTTVQEGLRACTVDELLDAVYGEVKVSGWSSIIPLIERAAGHLKDRAARAAAELAAAKQTQIPPPKEEMQDAPDDN